MCTQNTGAQTSVSGIMVSAHNIMTACTHVNGIALHGIDIPHAHGTVCGARQQQLIIGRPAHLIHNARVLDQAPLNIPCLALVSCIAQTCSHITEMLTGGMSAVPRPRPVLGITARMLMANRSLLHVAAASLVPSWEKAREVQPSWPRYSTLSGTVGSVHKSPAGLFQRTGNRLRTTSAWPDV